MKKLTLALAVIFGVAAFSSCTKENVQPTSHSLTKLDVSGDKGTLSQADDLVSGDKGTLSQADGALVSADKGTLSQADATIAAKTKKK